MITALVLTPWVQHEGAWTPRIEVDYPLKPGEELRDITAQLATRIPPRPNQYLIQAVMQPATFTALSSNSTYTVLTAYDELGNPAGGLPRLDEVATQNRVNQIINKLSQAWGTNKATRDAFAAELATVIVAGRTWRENADALVLWLKNRPAA